MSGLPLGWTVLPLSDLAEVRLGRQRSPKNHSGDSMRPYLRAANVGWSGLLLADVKTMNFTEDEMKTYGLAPGDLLLSEASGSPAEVGKSALWSGEIDSCAFQNTLLRIRTHRMEPKFLLHYFRFVALTRQFVEHSRGVGIHHLGRARLAAWPTPVPPPSGQRQIVDLLEDHLSRLDAADSDLRRSKQRLIALRDQMIERALAGVEVGGRRVDAFLADAGTRDEGIVSLPTEWRWARLADVADVVGGVTKDAGKELEPSYVEVPYLRVANVQRGALNLESVATIRVSRAKAEALTLLDGDVLLNEGGDRDKLARGWVWEGQIDGCIHQNHVFRARLRDRTIDPYFISWTANTFGGRWAQVNGKQSVNLASISLSTIRKMPVIVPPPGVSTEIVARLHMSLDSIDRLIGALDDAINRSSALRRAVLSAAFEGRLTEPSTSYELVKEVADA